VVTSEHDDPYVVLGLQRGATSEQVRQAYFRMVRVHTPEAHPQEFKRVREAYEALRSPRHRTELAVLAFEESVAEVDLDLLAQAVESEVDLAALALAAELSASDFACAEFPGELTPVHEEDLFDA
jgi:curved DNA-binding protein CbpA